MSPDFDSLVVAFGANIRRRLAAASTPRIILTAGAFAPDECQRAAEEFAAFCEGGGFTIH